MPKLGGVKKGRFLLMPSRAKKTVFFLSFSRLGSTVRGRLRLQALPLRHLRRSERAAERARGPSLGHAGSAVQRQQRQGLRRDSRQQEGRAVHLQGNASRK